MSGALPAAATPTRRLALSVAGLVLTRWMQTEVNRNLRDIAGSFSVTYRDSGREALAFSPDLDPFPRFPTVLAGQACSVALDGATVLTGWIDEVDADWEGDQLTCTITGRDKTGDLVDCAAAPTGPVEYRNLNALQITQAICKPFGITARADVDVGGVFPVFGIEADEIALSAIEKAARQQALLVVSDGVGGLLLTVQQQADWSLRIAKGMGSTLNYKVLDWRAGPNNALWLPNALSHVTDAYVGIDKDMLISGVKYIYDEKGVRTELELAGRTAFDRIDEAADDPRYIVSRKPKSFGPTRNG